MRSHPIDYHTLFLASAIIATAFLALHTIQARKTYPGFARAGIGTVLFTLAVLVGDLRGFVPDAILIIQVMAICTFGLVDSGIRLFCESPRRGRWPFVYVVAAMVLETFLFFGQPLYLRIIVNSLLLIPIYVDASLPLLSTPPKGRNFGYRFTAAVFGLGVVTACIRITAMLRLQRHVSPYFAVHPVNTAFFFLIMFMLVFLSFGLLTLAHERLMADLNATHDRLRSTHEHLLLALEASNSGTFEWILKGDLNIWGSMMEKLYGFEPGAFPGTRKAWLECVLPEDVAQVDEANREALKTGYFGAEWRIRRKNDGQVRWILSHARVQFDQDGKPERMIGINADITEQKQTEERIRLSEQRYRQLSERMSLALEASQSGIFEWNIKENITDLSPMLEKILGLEPGTFPRTYKDWLAYVYPEDVSRAEEAVRESFKTGFNFTQYRIRRKSDGQIRWVQSRARVDFDHEGKPERMIGIAVDVTEQKQAEEKVKLSEERYRVLSEHLLLALEASQSGTFEWWIKEDAHIWGPTVEKLYGFEPETFPGTYEAWHERIYPEDVAQVEEDIKESLKTGVVLTQFRIRRKTDGQVRWMLSNARVHFDEEGKPERMIGINLDITVQKEYEEKLKLSEQRYRSLVRASSQLVWTSDARGYFGHEIEDWQKFTGQTADQVHEFGWLNAIHPEDRDRALKAWQHAAATRSPYTVEYRLRRHDGTYRVMQERAAPVFDDAGQVFEWIGMSTDITEQRLYEERVRVNEKLAVVGRLALNVSHEINNPLAGITNIVYLLESDPGLSESSRKLLSVAAQEVNRASQAATRNLRFANPSPLGSGYFDLGELADSVAALFQSQFETDHIFIERDYRTRVRLRCDPHDVQDVIANLFSNAHDAMRKGGKLIIRLREAHTWGSAIRGLKLTIADTGTGIPRSVKNKIFDPFFTTKEETGAGLGLWVCIQIMRKYEGRISYSTSTDPRHAGTVFTLFFPFELSPAAHAEDVRPAA